MTQLNIEMVSYKLTLLKVDHIVVLKDGRVSEQGSYSELLANKGDFADFLLEYMVGGDETEELGDIVGDLQQGGNSMGF